MRASGVRDILNYCRDHRSSHQVETNAYGMEELQVIKRPDPSGRRVQCVEV